MSGDVGRAFVSPRCLRCDRFMRVESAEIRYDGGAWDIGYRCDGCSSEYTDAVRSDAAARDAVLGSLDPAVSDALSLLMVDAGDLGKGENRALIEASRDIANAAIKLCDALGVDQRGSVGDRLVRCLAAVKKTGTTEHTEHTEEEVKEEEDRAFGELGDNDSWSGPDDAGVCAECGVRVQLEQMNIHTVDYRCPRCRRVFTQRRGTGSTLVVGGVPSGEAPSAPPEADHLPAGRGEEQEGAERDRRVACIAVDVVCAMVRSDLASRLFNHVYKMDPSQTDEEIAERVDVRLCDHAVKLAVRLVGRLDAELSLSSPAGDEEKEGGSV